MVLGSFRCSQYRKILPTAILLWAVLSYHHSAHGVNVPPWDWFFNLFLCSPTENAIFSCHRSLWIQALEGIHRTEFYSVVCSVLLCARHSAMTSVITVEVSYDFNVQCLCLSLCLFLTHIHTHTHPISLTASTPSYRIPLWCPKSFPWSENKATLCSFSLLIMITSITCFSLSFLPFFFFLVVPLHRIWVGPFPITP